MFPVCGLLSRAEVLADPQQPELGIEVPHLHYWSNNGEFTQVRTRLWLLPHSIGFSWHAHQQSHCLEAGTTAMVQRRPRHAVYCRSPSQIHSVARAEVISLSDTWNHS
jgi:hypothetical protein